jgi:hypothetical protein
MRHLSDSSSMASRYCKARSLGFFNSAILTLRKVPYLAVRSAEILRTGKRSYPVAK